MSELDLSVIIVSYRSSAAVLRCLESLEAGRGDLRMEIHVVDNDSRDGTVERIRDEHPQVRLTALDSNRGFSKATNIGLSRAHGRHVLILNPDVRVPEETLTGLLAYLGSHPEIDVIAPKLLQPDGRAQGACGMAPDQRSMLLRSLGLAGLAYRHGPLQGDARLPYFLFPSKPTEVDLLVGAFVLARRTAFETVGLLDEGYFLYGEDMDWCQRARAAGLTLVHHPGFQAQHEQGASAGKDPLTALTHFHDSAVRYFLAHEAPGLPPWLRLLARASLELRYRLAKLRHHLRVSGAHRIYLALEPRAGKSVATASA